MYLNSSHSFCNKSQVFRNIFFFVFTLKLFYNKILNILAWYDKEHKINDQNSNIKNKSYNNLKNNKSLSKFEIQW
jgi:hypothetical protein